MSIVTSVAHHYHKPEASVSDMRICYIFVIGFAGLLRCDELLAICRENISICHDHMSIFFKQRKNDQHKTGHTVYVARIGGIACPVAITEKYLSMLSKDPDQHLVCRLTSGNRPQKHALSYSRVREIMIAVFKQLNLDASKYGTHSLKRGGATRLFNSGLVSEQEIDDHAGWKSKESKKTYIVKDLDQKLKASKALFS